MGAIPTQRETTSRASGVPAHSAEPSAQARATLPGSSLAPGAARALLRLALTDWTGLRLPGTEQLTDRLTEDALVVVSELVTNAVVHAGTDVEVSCRLEEDGSVVVEACDRHPSRAPGGGAPERPYDEPEYGRGLRLVAALCETWGITYRAGAKTVWARLSPHTGPAAAGQPGTQPGTQIGAGTPGQDLRFAGLLPTHEPQHARQDRSGGSDGPVKGSAEGPVEGPVEGSVDRAIGGPVEGPIAGVGPVDRDRLGESGAPDEYDGFGDRFSDGFGDRFGDRALQDREWLGRGALSFLAEASDLLAGQLDEDLVTSLTGQLLVPRLADWCAVWLEDESPGRPGAGTRLARVWHSSESRIEELRRALEKDPPPPPNPAHPGPAVHPWPGGALGPHGTHGAALSYRLVAGGRPLGTLVIGRAGPPRFPDEITGLVEDLSRRVALAVGAARQYARQATISAVLQRGLLPGAVAEIPGVRTALVHEPCDKGGPSGDFYDLFPAGDGRWCFAVGDVQGKGPEAAVVIGLARPWLRLLAREGYGVPGVLDRLNQLLLDDATEAADAAARALVAAGARPATPGDGPQTRFLSLLYGELVPFDGGIRCTLASAGHPLPLLLGPDGTVRTAAQPQTLLGVIEDTTYLSDTVELRRGDTLLCVTDGVTERRDGSRQLDDGDGLAAALAGCAGLDAGTIAEHIRRLVHDFGSRPPEDDLALLVLQAE
ncbi:SpoIIE family protein phosphatase [Streptomyces poriticola]|uniref:SpoIIE family protein phosphatase n=1 Tax=Streptomyces poriticola TaxID=3120506 RepID=UPI002FCE1B6F